MDSCNGSTVAASGGGRQPCLVVHCFGDGWGAAADKEKEAIVKDFEKADDWARRHGRPIYLGEFGALEKGDMESRARWASFVARQAEKRGWSWAWWQFDGNFIAYDTKQDAWVEPILRALVPSGGARPDPSRRWPRSHSSLVLASASGAMLHFSSTYFARISTISTDVGGGNLGQPICTHLAKSLSTHLISRSPIFSGGGRLPDSISDKTTASSAFRNVQSS